MDTPLHLGFVELYDKSTSRVTVLDQTTLREVCRGPLRLGAGWRKAAAGRLVDAVLQEFPTVSKVFVVESGGVLATTASRREPRVPLYVASRSTALAHAAPSTLERFVLIDFAGTGTLSLVARADGACSARIRPHESSLCELLQVENLAQLTAPTAPRDAAERIASLLSVPLRIARDFGYRATVVAAGEHVDAELARRVAECIEALDREGCLPGAVLTEDAVRRGTIAALAPARGENHVRTSVSSEATSLSMHVMREIAYTVTQLTSPIFDATTTAFADLVGRRPLLLAVDECIDALYGAQLRAYAARYLNVFGIITLKAGEANKDLRQVERVCKAAIAAGLPRDGVIAAVGGGVVLDIAGTAAALYRRGVAFVRIPTTLLGMVDVAVGIKQGVNFNRHKNIVGTFYAPLGVLNDPAFLRTAPPRELACGVAEIVKIAIAADAELFELLEGHLEELMRSSFQSPSAIARAVLDRAAAAMMVELAPNLYEDNLERAVDFGHSFSPTLEIRSNYRLQHGEAVAIDMLLSTAIAVRRRLCPASLLERMVALYDVAGLCATDDSCTVKLLTEALDEVKAHRGGRLNFPIPLAVGKCGFLQRVGADECRAALAAVARASAASAP
ncbi:MAG TPA: sedoheptulose 7-phosphate cyclase, partial [Candidatus Cybelea sp.]|nr:sedoheptulose 7-phosphate cyclase [Candidatus Cybelea sp.]